MPTPRCPLSALLALLLIGAACQPPEPPPPPPRGERFESSALGIALASLPPGVEVAPSAGEALELTAPGPGGEGRLRISLGPLERAGINLVEEVKSRKAWFEETEGARYFGNRELMAPIGTAFTARGTYPSAGGEVEETTVYAIHPLQNRILTLVYTYPPGESEARVEQLLDILGEIEPLAPPTPE